MSLSRRSLFALPLAAAVAAPAALVRGAWPAGVSGTLDLGPGYLVPSNHVARMDAEIWVIVRKYCEHLILTGNGGNRPSGLFNAECASSDADPPEIDDRSMVWEG